MLRNREEAKKIFQKTISDNLEARLRCHTGRTTASLTCFKSMRRRDSCSQVLIDLHGLVLSQDFCFTAVKYLCWGRVWTHPTHTLSPIRTNLIGVVYPLQLPPPVVTIWGNVAFCLSSPSSHLLWSPCLPLPLTSASDLLLQVPSSHTNTCLHSLHFANSFYNSCAFHNKCLKALLSSKD